MTALFQGFGDVAVPMAPGAYDFYSQNFFKRGSDLYVHPVREDGLVRLAYWDAQAQRGVTVDVPPGIVPTPSTLDVLTRFYAAMIPSGNTSLGVAASAALAPVLVNPTPELWQTAVRRYDAFVQALAIQPAPFPTTKVIAALAALGLIGGGIYLWRKVR